jgi:hypothetical protein
MSIHVSLYSNAFFYPEGGGRIYDTNFGSDGWMDGVFSSLKETKRKNWSFFFRGDDASSLGIVVFFHNNEDTMSSVV